jgi:hypothetical protein
MLNPAAAPLQLAVRSLSNPRGDADLARFIESVKSFSVTGFRIFKRMLIFRKQCVFTSKTALQAQKVDFYLYVRGGGVGAFAGLCEDTPFRAFSNEATRPSKVGARLLAKQLNHDLARENA